LELSSLASDTDGAVVVGTVVVGGAVVVEGMAVVGGVVVLAGLMLGGGAGLVVVWWAPASTT
jgi:hypothetical protein